MDDMIEISDNAKRMIAEALEKALGPTINKAIDKVKEQLDDRIDDVGEKLRSYEDEMDAAIGKFKEESAQQLRAIDKVKEQLDDRIDDVGEKLRSYKDEMDAAIGKFKEESAQLVELRGTIEEGFEQTMPPFRGWHWVVMGLMGLSFILNIALLVLVLIR